MKRFLPIVLAFFVAFAFSAPAAAASGKGSSSKSSSSAGKTVHVKGYTKKDGTYVAPHDRKPPKEKGTASTSTTASTTTRSKTSSTAHTTTASAVSTTGSHPSSYCATCARDAKGRILRGSEAKDAFKRQTGFAKGRPGYVIDHVIPLACGGQDDTSNMQWQTLAASKAKDKTERAGCGK